MGREQLQPDHSHEEPLNLPQAEDQQDATSPFPDAASARRYLRKSLENFDCACDENRPQLRQAIEGVLSSTKGEIITTLSLAAKMKKYFGQSERYRTDDYSLGKLSTKGYSLGIYQVVDYGPEFVEEVIEERRTKRHRIFFKKDYITEYKVQRPALPEEKTEEITESVGLLYIDPPNEDKYGRKEFAKAERNSYWILSVASKDAVERAEIFAADLHEAFPEITIELRIDINRKNTTDDFSWL